MLPLCFVQAEVNLSLEQILVLFCAVVVSIHLLNRKEEPVETAQTPPTDEIMCLGPVNEWDALEHCMLRVEWCYDPHTLRVITKRSAC